MLKSSSEALTWRVMNDVDFICWTEKKLVNSPASRLWQTLMFLLIFLNHSRSDSFLLFPLCWLYWGICHLDTERFLKWRVRFGRDSGLCTVMNTWINPVCLLMLSQSGFITHSHFLLLYSSKNLEEKTILRSNTLWLDCFRYFLIAFLGILHCFSSYFCLIICLLHQHPMCYYKNFNNIKGLHKTGL